MPEWTPRLGAIAGESGTTFRVWAPACDRIEIVIEAGSGEDAKGGSHEGTKPRMGDHATAPVFGEALIRPLVRDDRGYWSARFDDVPPGTRYRYRLDGKDDRVFPDPASRSQPDGVHGASEVIDPSRFAWTDGGWRPPALRDLIVYELHVGTFSPDGTYRGVVARLRDLVRLGVTAIELMPLGDFPGLRNWGYDGVAIFAPARCYGAPDDLRALVDAAHAHGLAVILDVVYNHLGPDGAYAHAFSPWYFSPSHHTAWGAAMNFDGPHAAEVRAFVVDNALHWVREYHVDGLRLDATHAIHDDSPHHILTELKTTIEIHASRPVIVIAEDAHNLAHLLHPVNAGGFGLDAVWADDFHHEVRVHLTGERESYYEDYTGSAGDIATTIRQGWFFTGQHSRHFDSARGTSAAGLEPPRFVLCLQNHDQVGNRADGARLHHQIDPAAYRAASTLLLLSPQTPLLFMGQEWAASAPFLFFTDHHDALGREVTKGRRREFRAFAAYADPAARRAIPDPQDVRTFQRSRLDWHERGRGEHARVLRLYERLIAIRRATPAIRDATCRSYRVRALDAATVALELLPVPQPADLPLPKALHVIVRLSGAGRVELAHPLRDGVEVLLTTEDDELVDEPMPVRIEALRDPDGARRGHAIEFLRPGAVVLSTHSEF